MKGSKKKRLLDVPRWAHTSPYPLRHPQPEISFIVQPVHSVSVRSWYDVPVHVNRRLDGSVTELAQYQLDSSPVFDGMAAGNGRLLLSLESGRLLCMVGQ